MTRGLKTKPEGSLSCSAGCGKRVATLGGLKRHEGTCQEIKNRLKRGRDFRDEEKCFEYTDTELPSPKRVARSGGSAGRRRSEPNLLGLQLDKNAEDMLEAPKAAFIWEAKEEEEGIEAASGMPDPVDRETALDIEDVLEEGTGEETGSERDTWTDAQTVKERGKEGDSDDITSTAYTTGRIMWHEKRPGMTAGALIPELPDDPAVIPNPGSEDTWRPFRNKDEYELASWFIRSKVSKSMINDYLKPGKMSSLKDKIGFKSADELFDLLNDIHYGFAKHNWTGHTFQIESEIDGKKATEWTIIYRDALGAVEFMLGYPPFAPHLTYAPEYHINANMWETAQRNEKWGSANNDEDDRTYTEMHTGNWWWHTQDNLPDGATVVPILLGSDKTQITSLAGDEAAWPVYITLGNLDRATRRSQHEPGTMLLGFIPIIKGVDDSSRQLKSHVYHKAIGIMLRCKNLSFIFIDT